MNLESIIGPAIVVVLAAIGGFGAFFTLRSKGKETGKRVTELEVDNRKLTDRLTGFELAVARDAKDYVNRTDLRDGLKEVEGRLGKRLDDVEHTVRNSATKMAAELKDMIRDVLPRRESNR